MMQLQGGVINLLTHILEHSWCNSSRQTQQVHRSWIQSVLLLCETAFLMFEAADLQLCRCSQASTVQHYKTLNEKDGME